MLTPPLHTNALVLLLTIDEFWGRGYLPPYLNQMNLTQQQIDYARQLKRRHGRAVAEEYLRLITKPGYLNSEGKHCPRNRSRKSKKKKPDDDTN